MALHNTGRDQPVSQGSALPEAAIIKNRAFVNGRWIEAGKKAVFDVTNPADGSVIAALPDMDAADTTAAIDAAQSAFDVWKEVPALERGKILIKWAGLIEKNADDLALLMTCEQGKPLAEAKGEILGGAATLQWCAEEGRRLYGEFIDGSKPGTRIVISRQPVGVAGAITPWNFPVSMITRKVAPALAAGCTIVLKPAEATPLSALALAALAQEAGLPDGVLNVVTSTKSSEVGKALTGDARVKKISFTGSTEVGRKLMAQAAEHIQKISLELGGNAPFIVFPSADLEKAAQGAIDSKFRNAGQTCICANRLYIHEDVFEKFQDIFLKKIRELKVGAGWEEGVRIGPLINGKAVEKIEKMIEEAVSGGAKIVHGGKRHTLGCTFFEPTLMVNARETDSISCAEIFGPVAVLYSFRDEDDVINRANNSPYGLAGYLYSTDQAQVWRVSDRLQYGMIGVNEPLLANDLAPFGGIKESGIGREGGQYGLLEFTNVKYRLFG